MVSYFREGITHLESLGLLTTLLPFFFVFIIIFGILEKTRVLGVDKGKPRKNINSMTAFIIAFTFIASTSRVESLTLYLQIVAVGLVFITSLLFLIASFQYKLYFERTTFIYAIIFIFVIVGFFAATGILALGEYGFIMDIVSNPVILGIAFFFVLLTYITGGTGKKIKERSGEKESKKESSSTGMNKIDPNNIPPYLRKLKPEEVPKNLRR